MRTAMLWVLSAIVMACAHRTAQPAAQAPPAEPRATAVNTVTVDDDLGSLELASTPEQPRTEVAQGETKSPLSPAPLEPAAPTVATTPPGSAHAPPEPQALSREEAQLRARIQSTLARDNSLSFTAKRVRVDVDDDLVTLLGEVRTAREKSEVAELVQKVSGVRRVQNRLAVIDQAARANTPAR